MNLWIVVRHESPGYIDGNIKIGLYTAESKEEAISKAEETEKSDYKDRGFYTATRCNEGLIQIVNLPTDYSDY